MSQRVLVADDSRLMRKIIGRTLNALGITDVCDAANGAEAIEMFNDGTYDFVHAKTISARTASIVSAAIARVEAKYGKIGTEFYFEDSVEGQAFPIPAKVVKMPFYEPPHKKSILGASK